jgi:transcriptional regulator with PAS, ATPase and Fis domain
LRSRDGGSILLDEIAVIAPTVQAKLLRGAQERESGSRWIRAHGRSTCGIIAATNRDLRQLVGEGKVQEDLFYRLNVIPITIPPLRERREDIPPLVEHFVRGGTRAARANASTGSRRRRCRCCGAPCAEATCASWRTPSSRRLRPSR